VTARSVAWGDLKNAWDMGGLPAATGTTRFGRLFRSMHPDQLDSSGWADVVATGIGAVVDLRNDYEVKDSPDRPASLTLIRRPIEDQSDTEFMATWGNRLGSPAYYPEILRRWPELVSAAIASIADAQGPVLFHCGAGRDRTGMIAALICTLVGVDRSAILDDYEAGVRAFNAWKLTNPFRERPQTATELDVHLASARGELSTFLDSIEVEGYLLGAGLRAEQIAAIRSRLLDD
jgi:protein-tyrosine phosphatase